MLLLQTDGVLSIENECVELAAWYICLVFHSFALRWHALSMHAKTFTLNWVIPFPYEKVHFIRDKNEGSICSVSQSLDRISGSKKEKDLYVVCLLRHLSGSAWHCLKILDYHKEKVILKKTKQPKIWTSLPFCL